MATAIALPALLSFEEYLQTSYHPDRDFVDEHLEVRNVGERDYNRTQILLGAWFLAHEAEWNINMLPDSAPGSHSPRCASLISAYFAEMLRVSRSLPLHLSCASRFCYRRIGSRASPALWTIMPRWACRISGFIDPQERVAYDYSHDGLLRLTYDRLAIPNTAIYVGLPTICQRSSDNFLMRRILQFGKWKYRRTTYKFISPNSLV